MSRHPSWSFFGLLLKAQVERQERDTGRHDAEAQAQTRARTGAPPNTPAVARSLLSPALTAPEPTGHGRRLRAHAGNEHPRGAGEKSLRHLFLLCAACFGACRLARRELGALPLGKDCFLGFSRRRAEGGCRTHVPEAMRVGWAGGN